MKSRQGKAWDKEEVFGILEEFYRLGCSTRKACDYAGIPHSTVATWLLADDVLQAKVTSWQNHMSTLARRNWMKQLDKGDYNASEKWLSKKEKAEFSERTETIAEVITEDISEERKEAIKKALLD